MNWQEVLLGQLPEAVYFPLFMIYSKELKEKRILFILTLIVEYFILVNIFKYNIWFQVTYTFMLYAILKFYYKEKSQITDIFTFAISSIILMIVSGFSYIIFYSLLHIQFKLTAIFSKLILFVLLFIINYRFYKIQNLYRKLWNRNDKVKKKIKSITFRCWNLVLFNFMFYTISIVINLINNKH